MTQYAILGDPIQHSLSPRIFKLFAEQTKQALDYQAILVRPEDLPAVLRSLRRQGYKGVNLTAPLKELALSLVDACSEQACAAKAINVLSFKEDGTCYGDNSDGLGFVRDLVQRKNYVIKDKTLLILGAGGAVRGLLPAVIKEAPRQVVICNRTEQKVRRLIADFDCPESPLLQASWQELHNHHFDLIINCTSAGTQGEIPLLPEAALQPATCYYDLSYGKNALPFIAWAKTQGATRIYDGLGMLIEQAAEAFYWWRHQRIATEPVHRLLAY